MYEPLKFSWMSTKIFEQEFKGRVTGVKVKAVDTTGAGDAFVGGILNSLAADLNLYKVKCPCSSLNDRISECSNFIQCFLQLVVFEIYVLC